MSEASVQADHRRPNALAWLADPTRLRLALLAYGLAACAFGGWQLARATPDNTPLMGMRQDGIRASIQVLDQGGPPLAAKFATIGAGQPRLFDYYRLPQGDDPGLYLYLPIAGHLLGVQDPNRLAKWLFVSAFLPLLLAFPLIFYELFESIGAGLLSPLLLVWKFKFLGQLPHYWVSAWCLLLCLPLLAVVYKHWRPRAGPLALAGLAIVGSFATSLRSPAGLPVLFGAIAVAFLRERRWARRLPIVALVAVAYLSISPLGIKAIDAYRDHWIQDRGTVAPLDHTTPWHSIYIGLGYVDNKYGIRYDDSVALAHARKVDPKVIYLSPEYVRIVRHLVWKTVRDDPGLLGRNVLVKSEVVARDTLDRFWLVLFVAPFMFLRARRRSPILVAGLLVALALPVGLLGPISVVPYPQYQLGWVGAWGVLWLLSVAWMVASAPALIAAARRAEQLPQVDWDVWRSRARALARRPLVYVLVVPLVVVVLLGIGPFGKSINESQAKGFYRQNASPLATRRTFAGFHQAGSWGFAHGLPAGWTAFGKASAQVQSGRTQVRTSNLKSDYQVLAPPRTLPEGRYIVRLRATVVQGGLELGVLNAERAEWIVTTHYWDHQRPTRAHSMFASFSLTKATQVKFILSNWAPSNRSSSWKVDELTLFRAGKGNGGNGGGP